MEKEYRVDETFAWTETKTADHTESLISFKR